MKKKFFQNEKFQGYFFPILYFVLSIAIVVTGCIIFKNKYYTSILVEGVSMQPTLVGGGYSGQSNKYLRSHYGYADLHKSAVNRLKRFDVCVTYYPSSWVGDEKTSIIKRVWGFPGETLNLHYAESKFTFTVTNGNKFVCQYEAPIVDITRTYSAEYYEGTALRYTTVEMSFHAAKFNVGNKTFYTNTSEKRDFSKTLGKDEYFVMGDNWGHSTDSYTKRDSEDKLTKKYLQGRAICINAYATSKNDQAVNIKKIKPRYNF